MGFQSVQFAKPDVFVEFLDRAEHPIADLSNQSPYYIDPGKSDVHNSLTAWHVGDTYVLRYGAAAEFRIDDRGTWIQARTDPTITAEAIAAYLVGPVLGFTLRLRGVLCLHASAIQIGSHAFALMGARGAGKSTLAASFSQSGHIVLTDDILRLEELDGHFWAYPSRTKFKLFPDSLSQVFGDSNDFPHLAPDTDKRVVPPASDPGRQIVPLRAVYVLGGRSLEASEPSIEEMNPMESMISLASHTYANYLLTPDMRRREFAQLKRLVPSVEARMITPQAELKELPRLRDFVTACFMKHAETI